MIVAFEVLLAYWFGPGEPFWPDVPSQCRAAIPPPATKVTTNGKGTITPTIYNDYKVLSRRKLHCCWIMLYKKGMNIIKLQGSVSPICFYRLLAITARRA